MFKRRSTALMVAALFGFAVPGCDQNKTVTIHYRPLANTYEITSNGAHATAQTGIFRIYRIYRIDNNEADAETFAFETSKVYVRNKDKAELMWVRKDGNVPYSEQSAGENVDPHTSAGSLPYYLVLRDSQQPEANDGWVPLRYDNSGGESILLVQDPAEPHPVFKQSMTSNDLPVQPVDQ